MGQPSFKLLVNSSRWSALCALLLLAPPGTTLGCSDDSARDDGGPAAATDVGGGDGASSPDAGQGDAGQSDAKDSEKAEDSGFSRSSNDASAQDATLPEAPAQLCAPCHADEDCAPAAAACVSSGASGSFCATDCSLDPGAPVACPSGYQCKSTASLAGKVATRCVKVGLEGQPGTCACSAWAIDVGASTECAATATIDGLLHACAGKRACGSGGLGACDAPTPATETCDGIDSDCDGDTDEATCPAGGPCVTLTCDGAKKSCVGADLAGPCDGDGNPCTKGDCNQGSCVEKPVDCDDGNGCTADTCEPTGACAHGPADGPCSDGNDCSIGDTCSGGACQAGKDKDCNDGNPCTDADLCVLGACQPGGPTDCDDGTACTTDTCDKKLGCAHGPAKADPKALCTCTEPDVVGGPGGDYAAMGDKAYIKYVRGTLPIILAAPHGGPLKPASIPDRTSGVTGNDSHSRETTLLLARELALATGRLPHVVINRLARIKLDANREIKEAAQGNKEAELAWQQFHGFIGSAKADLHKRCGKGLFVDMHTNGHSEKWLELGYLLSAKDLGGNDAALDAAAMVKKSALRSLATVNGAKLSALVRGPASLGGKLQSAGVKVVPSPKHKDPAGGGYFSGGYNTQQHGSRDGGAVDAMQVESHFSLMDTEAKRLAYAKKLAAALLAWLKEQYGVDPVDKAHAPPAHQACSKAAKVDFLGGVAEAAGSTTFAANEFSSSVSCGSGFAMDGPQLYFELDLKAGESYAVTIKADFPARTYLAQKTCSASALSKACAASSLNGVLSEVDEPATTTFKAAKTGLHLLVIDSRAPQWHGAFTIAVKPLKTP